MTEQEFTANTSLINRRLADVSHAGTSFVPDVRAMQEIESFTAEVQDVYNRLNAHTKTESQKAFLIKEMQRFQTGYAQRYNALLAAKGRCFSSMITGGSNFNNRAHGKANSAESKRHDEAQEFKDRAEKAILRAIKDMAVEEAGGEIAALQRSIARAEELQESMKTCNAILRKKTTTEAEKVQAIMTATGWDEPIAKKVLTPDFAGRQGFSYHLTNSSANIRRMKQRLAELQTKESTPTTTREFQGGRIVDDHDLDRVCVFHDQKPAPEVIQALKLSGFHWSPKVGAWMRKRTSQALQSARNITGIK